MAAQSAWALLGKVAVTRRCAFLISQAPSCWITTYRDLCNFSSNHCSSKCLTTTRRRVCCSFVVWELSCQLDANRRERVRRKAHAFALVPRLETGKINHVRL